VCCQLTQGIGLPRKFALFGGKVVVVILFNPRVTKAHNRRFPLSVLSLAAVLEGREDYVIVDGNLEADPIARIRSLMEKQRVELLAVSVMPGPQMAAAIEPCRAVRIEYPDVPIVWGGYFPSVHTDAALNAPYVDFAVRGQGEETLLELLEALRGRRQLGSVRGLAYKDSQGKHHQNPERPLKGPDAFPSYPYHRIPARDYLLPSFFGKRTAVHQASIGCPYPCTFCGVVSVFGSRERMESPTRTEAVLRQLKERYGADAIQFYDNNFFLREDHARELCDRIMPLGMRWWCEARIDVVNRYSDQTLDTIRRAGCAMIFFGAESGSDWVLKEMKKGITTRETLELASRIRRFGIIPEFSFVIGNPNHPERDIHECLAFIRKLKVLNPDAEIIINHYTPVPQRGQMYGNVEALVEFPTTPEEWATERWLRFSMHVAPEMPWLTSRTKRLIDDFEVVVASRWPTVQDIRMSNWSRRFLKLLSSWRYAARFYAFPVELIWAQRITQIRKPRFESL
jgi:anaerobic magnesium-protoporphyrin IX monomethyl ester cyclase